MNESRGVNWNISGRDVFYDDSTGSRLFGLWTLFRPVDLVDDKYIGLKFMLN